MQQHNVEFVYIKYKIYLEYLPHSVVQFSGHLLCPMCSEKAVVFISGVHAAFSSWEILLLYYFLLSLKHLSHTVMGSAALDLWHDFSRLWPWSGCRWVVLKSSCSVSSLAVCHVVCQCVKCDCLGRPIGCLLLTSNCRTNCAMVLLLALTVAVPLEMSFSSYE